MRTQLRSIHGLAFVPLIGVAGVSHVSAQVAGTDTTSVIETPEPALAPALDPGPWSAVAVEPMPGTTVSALTVILPVGSSDDPEGLSGVAWISGEVARSQLLSTLPADVAAGTEVDVAVEQERSVFRAVTLPEHWTSVFRALERTLFEEPVSAHVFEEVRTGLLEVFAFEVDAPHREFELEFRRLLTQMDDSWSRDPRGDPISVQAVTPEDVRAFRRRRYTRSETTATVAGQVEGPPEIAELTGADWPGNGDRSPSYTALRDRTDLTPSPVPWIEGTRVVLSRPVTSTWIGVAFPVEPDLPETHLELLVHRLRRDLDTRPPLPGTFDVAVEMKRLRGSRLVVVEAAVLPNVASVWETRILDAVSTLRDDRPEPGFFAWDRRHFRSFRLLSESGPETRGLRVARDLAEGVGVRALGEEIWSLEPAHLWESAGALGSPRILVMGPDLTTSRQP